jgi:deoxyadenosine/deoxycytidine kinase
MLPLEYLERVHMRYTELMTKLDSMIPDTTLFEYHTETDEETQRKARDQLRAHLVHMYGAGQPVLVLVMGNIGAGKTTLMRQLGAELGGAQHSLLGGLASSQTSV